MSSRADATQIDMFGGYNEVCVVDKDPIRSGLEEMDDRKHTRYVQRHHALVADIAEIGLPAPGEQFRNIFKFSYSNFFPPDPWPLDPSVTALCYAPSAIYLLLNLVRWQVLGWRDFATLIS